MESRTKAAEAAASVIPFHCIICFDEFNTVERPPMVLPCGHTYVCLPCTKRLKRCMECRESLFLPTSTNTNTTSGNSNRNSSSNASSTAVHHPNHPHHYGSNSRYSPSTPTKKPLAAPVPLPIPKNLVLLAMMEAAAGQRAAFVPRSAAESQNKEDAQAAEEEEAFQPDAVLTGLTTLTGPCGTYAVRAPEGLTVLARDPRQEMAPRSLEVPPASVLLPEIASFDSVCSTEETKSEDEHIQDEEQDEDERLDQMIEQSAATMYLHRAPSVEELETLVKGQTVQVVSFAQGVAALARGRGFILATTSQLVKVGGPLEESCRLEGLMDTVKTRGEELAKSLDENRQVEELLRLHVEQAQAKDPTHPVVSEPPLPVRLDAPTTPEGPSTPTEMSLHPPYTPRPDLVKNPHPNSFHTPQTETHPTPHSPASIDNSDMFSAMGGFSLMPGPVMPRYGSSGSYEEQENYYPTSGTGFGCGVGFIVEEDEGTAPDHFRHTAVRFDRPRSATVHDASTWAPNLAGSFDAVDFRTGLSGHRGLSHGRRKPGMSPQPRSQIRMMGEHRGLATFRMAAARHQAPNQPLPYPSTTHNENAGIPNLGPRFSTPSTTTT